MLSCRSQYLLQLTETVEERHDDITAFYMTKFIVATKKNMTQIYNEAGHVVPVTVVDVEPCVVTQVKDQAKDGYTAIQVGYGVRKEKNIAKPQRVHNKKLGMFRGYKEFRIGDDSELKVGDKVTVEQFEVGDKVKVTGTSKGKGFQGVVKRHGFKGAPASHGTKDQVRMPGSIGATGPQRVFKGTRMGGQMGDQQATSLHLEIVKIDEKTNQLYLRGAVPGGRNAVVTVYA